MATIRDVARLAGVSLGTVSKVLGGSRSVRPKLAERIRAAMAALDYHPDQVARSLRVRRTQTIGVLVPDVTNPFFTGVIRGVESEARQNGYAVVLCDSNEDPVLENTNLDTLFARRVDGVLVIPTHAHTAQEHLVRRRFPMVFIDRIPPSFSGTAVVADNAAAAYEATHYLIGLGHERLAIITGNLTLSNGLDRLEGFRNALQKVGLPLHVDYLQRGDFLMGSGYDCCHRLLRLAIPPTAILICSNQMTLGAMRAMREMSVSCPGQISILGFDDFEWVEHTNPRLTTVAQPTLEMGKQALQILLQRIKSSPKVDGSQEPDVVLRLPTELRVRDSTAPPPASFSSSAPLPSA